jgi:hypothetical protein
MHQSFRYAGIGSRETPPKILEGMQRVAARLEACGYRLRSGAADGADIAFESGVKDARHKEIWLPWDGYNNRRKSEGDHIRVLSLHGDSVNLTAKFHPAWDRCAPAARKMHARNYHIVLGEDLHSPVDFVVCWTQDGGEDNAMGGTGQGVRIANAHKIPVFNLKNKESRFLLKDKIEEIERCQKQN